MNRRSKHICMVSYSFYDIDARVTRYAETLVRRGDTVDVLALGPIGSEARRVLNGVNVFHIQSREANEQGKLSYLYRLVKFLIKSVWVLNRKHREWPYDLIHVHSVPDFEVFAAWLPKWKGAKIILDIHDIVPEFYAAKFKKDIDSFLCRLLILIEKLSVNFADWVIISNHLWREKLRRSVRNGKCSVILNYPDEYIFFRRRKKSPDEKFVVLYPGSLNWHQGLDIALQAMAKLQTQVPEIEFHIYGRGGARASLEALARDLGVSGKVLFYDPISKEKIAEMMAEADLGVVPKRNDSFGAEAFSTKILEFMAVGTPVLVARTKIDSFYFNEQVVKFFEPGDAEDLAKAMLQLVRGPEERQKLVDNSLEFIKDYGWEGKKQIYLDLVDDLVGK